jgi:hypothetical protein
MCETVRQCEEAMTWIYAMEEEELPEDGMAPV